jgi:hypothetical protein
MTHWLTCATARPVVRRAAASALVVGPLLIAINHGDAILAGDVSIGRLFQMVLTLVVPYAVSTCSSVASNADHLRSQPAPTATEIPEG